MIKIKHYALEKALTTNTLVKAKLFPLSIQLDTRACYEFLINDTTKEARDNARHTTYAFINYSSKPLAHKAFNVHKGLSSNNATLISQGGIASLLAKKKSQAHSDNFKAEGLSDKECLLIKSHFYKDLDHVSLSNEHSCLSTFFNAPLSFLAQSHYFEQKLLEKSKANLSETKDKVLSKKSSHYKNNETLPLALDAKRKSAQKNCDLKAKYPLAALAAMLGHDDF